MALPALDPDTNQLLVGRVVFMLKALYEAEKVESSGFESTSWRGQLTGFRCAIEIIYGAELTDKIMEAVVEEAQKSFRERTDDLMKRAFPRLEKQADNQGYIYVSLGQYDKALAEGYKSLEKNPISARRYAFLMNCYTMLNRLNEARALADEANRKNIDSPGLRISSYLLAFLSHDVAGMERQVAWGIGKPGIEDLLFSLEASTQSFFGRLRAAREFSQRAIRSAEQLGENTLVARYQVDVGLREALFGNAAEARLWVETALRNSNDRNAKFKAALALAFAGEEVETRSLIIDERDTSPLEDTIVTFNYLPTLNAQLALNRNDPSTAIEVLVAAIPYELGNVGKTALYPVLVRGNAYLMARRGKEAAAEFRKILEHPGIVLNGPIGVRGRLGLARAHILQGETTKAEAAYNEFLTFWKGADLDIPILKQAKAEYAKLQ
jgi:tetratricopeptide (TPR) repeat protein